MSALAVIEGRGGNLGRAWQFRTAAIKTAREIGDITGLVNELSNLAGWLSSSGQYEAVLRLLEAPWAKQAQGILDSDCIRVRNIIRANALYRLGHYDRAVVEVASVLASTAAPLQGKPLQDLILAQLLCSLLFIALNRHGEARFFVAAAKEHARRLKIATLNRAVDVAEAALSAADGRVVEAQKALSDLADRLERGCEGSDAAELIDGNYFDCLHELHRVQVAAGERQAALATLKRIGDAYLRNARAMATQEESDEPLLAMTVADKVAEVRRYLDVKVVETHASQAETGSWELLLNTAANASAIEDESLEHGPRVACLATHVARRLGLSGDNVEAIGAAALTHDVGKLGVADALLRRREPLDEQEQGLYDAHAEAGAKLLASLTVPHRQTVIDVARHHHTAFDGHGAHGSALRGDAIPLAARIVAVCDAFDAWVKGRPRRPPASVDEALRELMRQSGRDFDPQVVDAFIDVARELRAEHGDLMAYLAGAASGVGLSGAQLELRRLRTAAGTTK
jgi:putative nucleotidyltransferase with HDIG domain